MQTSGGVNAIAFEPEDCEVPASQRPTAPPPPPESPHTSGVQLKAYRKPSFPPPIPRTDPPPPELNVRWVPIVANRAGLAVNPPALTSFMLLACMNGVLSVADLSEVTGIPLGAVIDAVRELADRGVIIFEK